MIRIAHLYDDADAEQRLLDALAPFADAAPAWALPPALAADPADLGRWAAEHRPDVLVLGPGIGVEQHLELAWQVTTRHPAAQILLVAALAATDWPTALRSGVREVVPASATTQLAEALRRMADSAALLHGAGGPAAPTRRAGRIVAVVSPKGGSGKTTVAANLFVGLARDARPALVDADLQFGDVATALRLDPGRTIADVARMPELDPLALKAYLREHRCGGHVLAAPDHPAEADEIKPQQVADVLMALAGDFSHVVVDTGAGLDEHTLAALDVADDVVLVTSLDVPNVRGMRKAMDALDQLGLSARRHLLLNRASSRVGLRVGDVEDLLGRPVDVQLPSSKSFPLATNEGTPLLSSQPRSAAGKRLAQLVARVTTPEATS